jgi:hypothetical protein
MLMSTVAGSMRARAARVKGAPGLLGRGVGRFR